MKKLNFRSKILNFLLCILFVSGIGMFLYNSGDKPNLNSAVTTTTSTNIYDASLWITWENNLYDDDGNVTLSGTEKEDSEDNIILDNTKMDKVTFELERTRVHNGKTYYLESISHSEYNTSTTNGETTKNYIGTNTLLAIYDKDDKVYVTFEILANTEINVTYSDYIGAVNITNDDITENVIKEPVYDTDEDGNEYQVYDENGNPMYNEYTEETNVEYEISEDCSTLTLTLPGWEKFMYYGPLSSTVTIKERSSSDSDTITLPYYGNESFIIWSDGKDFDEKYTVYSKNIYSSDETNTDEATVYNAYTVGDYVLYAVSRYYTTDDTVGEDDKYANSFKAYEYIDGYSETEEVDELISTPMQMVNYSEETGEIFEYTVCIFTMPEYDVLIENIFEDNPYYQTYEEITKESMDSYIVSEVPVLSDASSYGKLTVKGEAEETDEDENTVYNEDQNIVIDAEDIERNRESLQSNQTSMGETMQVGDDYEEDSTAVYVVKSPNGQIWFVMGTHINPEKYISSSLSIEEQQQQFETIVTTDENKTWQRVG